MKTISFYFQQFQIVSVSVLGDLGRLDAIPETNGSSLRKVQCDLGIYLKYTENINTGYKIAV